MFGGWFLVLSSVGTLMPLPPSSLRTRVVVLGVFLILVFFLLFSYFSPLSPRPFFSVDSIENCRSLSREAYAVSPTVFSSLPSPPKCFDSIISVFHAGRFSDNYFFDESYFLQPEFFPNFLSEGLRVWQNPDYTHYGAVGFGAHPFASVLSLSSQSSARFWMHSGFGVRSVQSVSLRWEFENPSDANLFSISLDENSSADFLLAPNFPKFHSGWVHPVDIRVTPLSSSLPSTSVLHIFTVPSSADFSSHPLVSLFPLFDSTDYVGGKRVYTLTITP